MNLPILKVRRENWAMIRDDILKMLSHPDRAEAKVIKVIHSCTKFEQLRMAHKVMRRYLDIYCDPLYYSECNQIYYQKYNELVPKSIPMTP